MSPWITLGLLGSPSPFQTRGGSINKREGQEVYESGVEGSADLRMGHREGSDNIGTRMGALEIEYVS